MRQNIMMVPTHGYGWFGPTPVGRGRRFVVQAWEKALLFEAGVLVETLAPGAYRRWARELLVRRVDMRPGIVALPVQEVPTADGVTVKITVAGLARVVDPVANVIGAQDADAVLYLAVQVALRELAAGKTVEELVGGRGDLGRELRGAVRGVDAVGLVVEQLELKDIVLPADLKRAQSEVLVARAQGLAALERARGETAALRNLANAARLATDNPALLQLRMLQEMGAASALTVVIGGQPTLA